MPQNAECWLCLVPASTHRNSQLTIHSSCGTSALSPFSLLFTRLHSCMSHTLRCKPSSQGQAHLKWTGKLCQDSRNNGNVSDSTNTLEASLSQNRKEHSQNYFSWRMKTPQEQNIHSFQSTSFNFYSYCSLGKAISLQHTNKNILARSGKSFWVLLTCPNKLCSDFI